MIPAEYGKLCNEIMHASSRIQSVAVINKMGRAVERLPGGEQEGAFKDKASEMLYMQSVLQVSMGRDFDEHYGPINYYVSERANATMLTFPLGDHVVLLTASKNSSPISLVRKVAAMIRDSEKQGLSELEGKLLVSA